jgi:hypothetical protein
MKSKFTIYFIKNSIQIKNSFENLLVDYMYFVHGVELEQQLEEIN